MFEVSRNVSESGLGGSSEWAVDRLGRALGFAPLQLVDQLVRRRPAELLRRERNGGEGGGRREERGMTQIILVLFPLSGRMAASVRSSSSRVSS